MTGSTTDATHQDVSALADPVIDLGRIALAFGLVERGTFHPDGVTRESDTTHTVMLGLVACALAEQWYPHLDRGLIAQYALVHDLVEVYAGDTPALVIDAAGLAYKDAREAAALGVLAEQFADTLPWIPLMIAQYEQRDTPEARLVKTVDKLVPKITDMLNGGATIAAHGLSGAQAAAAWTAQRAAMQAYASDFPEILDLTEELITRITGSH